MKFVKCLGFFGGSVVLSCSEVEKLDCSVDGDSDGLTDCEEADLGTDATIADSDGDGFGDKEEMECGSDPLLNSDVCFACGWSKNTPSAVGEIGAYEGMFLSDLGMVDQCGDLVSLHQLSGAYQILFMTAQWCGACKQEVKELPVRAQEISTEYGVSIRYTVVLFEDNMGGIPSANIAEEYAAVIGFEQELPILADTSGSILASTPYNGAPLPGKCLLSPNMQIMACSAGSNAENDILDGL